MHFTIITHPINFLKFSLFAVVFQAIDLLKDVIKFRNGLLEELIVIIFINVNYFLIVTFFRL